MQIEAWLYIAILMFKLFGTHFELTQKHAISEKFLVFILKTSLHLFQETVRGFSKL